MMILNLVGEVENFLKMTMLGIASAKGLKRVEILEIEQASITGKEKRNK